MSYDFNGTTAYGSTTSTPLDNSPFSIVAYVKPDAQEANRGICCLLNSGAVSDYYYLRISATDTVDAETRDGGGADVIAATTATISEAGTWQLIHGTWAASDASRRAGIDAANYVEETTANSPNPRPDQIWVGARPTGPLNLYDGKLAYVAIYNKVLSDSELTELLTVQPESASSYADCVIYWDMRDDEGTTAIPNAKNPGTYDLTLYGATKPTYVTPADNPTLGTGTTKYLKLLAHSSAQSASGIEVVAFSAPSGTDYITGTTRYGSDNGLSFEGTLEGGQAVLKVPAADVGCGSLAVDTVVAAVARNTTYTTGVVSATIIEE